MSFFNDQQSFKWIKFLALWAIVPAIATGALAVTLGIVISTYGAAPVDFKILEGVAENPIPLRLLGSSQILLWFSIGGLLIGFAGLFQGYAPIRSTFLKACGYCLGISALGGIMQFTATVDLANRYVASYTDREIFQTIQPTLSHLIESHFYSGELLSGLGFLLIFSLTFKVADIPRWLSVWMGLSGLYSVLLLLLRMFGVAVPFIAIPIYVLFFALALYLAIAIVLIKRKNKFSKETIVTSV
jgi:hypothetical protein